MTLDDLPRLIYVAQASWGLVLLLARWRVTRILTPERRFLLLALASLFANHVVSGVLKIVAGTPADTSTWISVWVMGLFLAYVHYSLPPEFRRLYHRLTRRR